MTRAYELEGDLANTGTCTNGRDFNKDLEVTAGDQTTMQSTNVAASDGVVITHLWSTAAGEPDNDDWPSGVIIPYRGSFQVSGAGADVETRAVILRVNSSCTIQQTLNTSSFTFGTGQRIAQYSGNPSAGASTDLYQLRCEAQKTAAHGGQRATVDPGHANSFADGPWPAAVGLIEHLRVVDDPAPAPLPDLIEGSPPPGLDLLPIVLLAYLRTVDEQAHAPVPDTIEGPPPPPPPRIPLAELRVVDEPPHAPVPDLIEGSPSPLETRIPLANFRTVDEPPPTPVLDLIEGTPPTIPLRLVLPEVGVWDEPIARLEFDLIEGSPPPNTELIGALLNYNSVWDDPLLELLAHLVEGAKPVIPPLATRTHLRVQDEPIMEMLADLIAGSDAPHSELLGQLLDRVGAWDEQAPWLTAGLREGSPPPLLPRIVLPKLIVNDEPLVQFLEQVIAPQAKPDYPLLAIPLLAYASVWDNLPPAIPSQLLEGSPPPIPTRITLAHLRVQDLLPAHLPPELIAQWTAQPLDELVVSDVTLDDIFAKICKVDRLTQVLLAKLLRKC